MCFCTESSLLNRYTGSLHCSHFAPQRRPLQLQHCRLIQCMHAHQYVLHSLDIQLSQCCTAVNAGTVHHRQCSHSAPPLSEPSLCCGQSALQSVCNATRNACLLMMPMGSRALYICRQTMSAACLQTDQECCVLADRPSERIDHA